MKLINPGVGEITDRLTILALKIHFAERQGKEAKHFRDERIALLSQIRSRTLNGKWFDTVLDLASVNAILWHAEDDLRAYRLGNTPKTASTVDVAELAFTIQELNDKRAGLIESINKDAGDSVGKEKLTE